jgi:hypothetical protein
MQRHECSKHNYLCINDSLKFLFPCENKGVTQRQAQQRRRAAAVAAGCGGSSVPKGGGDGRLGGTGAGV